MSAPSLTPSAPPPGQPTPTVAPHPGLRERTVVLVGLMGAGKSTIGRALASALHIPFRDADEEIERAARRSVAEIFAERGEAEFRDGERRVIARLLTQEPPHVLATGGGAFAHPATRALARDQALCVWLKVELEVLARRVSRRATRRCCMGATRWRCSAAWRSSAIPITARPTWWPRPATPISRPACRPCWAR